MKENRKTTLIKKETDVMEIEKEEGSFHRYYEIKSKQHYRFDIIVFAASVYLK